MRTYDTVTLTRVALAALLGAFLCGVGFVIVARRLGELPFGAGVIGGGIFLAAFAAALPVLLFEVLVRRRAAREIEDGVNPHGDPNGPAPKTEADFD